MAVDPTVDHAPARVLDLTLRSAHPDGRPLRSPADANEENLLGQIDDADEEAGPL